MVSSRSRGISSLFDRANSRSAITGGAVYGRRSLARSDKPAAEVAFIPRVRRLARAVQLGDVERRHADHELPGRARAGSLRCPMTVSAAASVSWIDAVALYWPSPTSATGLVRSSVTCRAMFSSTRRLPTWPEAGH